MRGCVWRPCPDFFTSVINLKLPLIIGVTIVAYVLSFTFWAGVWYLVWRCVHATGVVALLHLFVFNTTGMQCQPFASKQHCTYGTYPEKEEI